MVGVKSPVCVKITVVLSPAVLTDASEAEAQQVHPGNIHGKEKYGLRIKRQAAILWRS